MVCVASFMPEETRWMIPGRATNDIQATVCISFCFCRQISRITRMLGHRTDADELLNGCGDGRRSPALFLGASGEL